MLHHLFVHLLFGIDLVLGHGCFLLGLLQMVAGGVPFMSCSAFRSQLYGAIASQNAQTRLARLDSKTMKQMVDLVL